MLHGDRTALLAMRFAVAAELEQIHAVRRELKDLRLLLRWRREMKYSPEQPRDEIGRWMPWEHGEGEESSSDSVGSETGEAFGIAPDGTEIESVAGIPDSEKNSTVQSFVSKYCDAGIRAVMPGQFLNEPIQRVMELAKAGDPAARLLSQIAWPRALQKIGDRNERFIEQQIAKIIESAEQKKTHVPFGTAA